MFYVLIALGAILGVVVGKYLPVIPYTYFRYDFWSNSLKAKR